MRRSRKIAVLAAAAALALAGCVSQGPIGSEAAFTAHGKSDFEKLGLSQTTIAPWEDGMRTSGARGTYEWWYFDFTLDDGSTMVVTFNTKDVTRPQTPLAPILTFKLDRPDGTTAASTVSFNAADFAAARDRCDVRLGANTVRGDLRDYTLHLDLKDVQADLHLHGTVAPWRPGTGYMLFPGAAAHYFAWLPSVPRGTVEGSLTVGGVTRHLSGVGYHDHNWGDTSLLDLIHDWYWGRAQIGDYTVIASYIVTSDRYGRKPIPVFMLARDGKIIADDASRVRFAAREAHVDPYTGKPVADLLVYDYDDGASHYRITFRREKDLARDRFIDHLQGMTALAARIAGFDGAYLRFTGPATLERMDGASTSETLTESAAVWELMYFGH
jgi:predicted secreted hydrolase